MKKKCKKICIVFEKVVSLQYKLKLKDMYKINHCFYEEENCQKEFKTLKQAIHYCNENYDEMYHIVKLSKQGTIIDIYKIVLGAYVLTAQSFSTDRVYSYFNF